MVKRKRTVSIEEERAQECQNCCEEEATSMGKLVELAPVSVATMINAEGGNNPHSHDTRSKQVGSKLPIETSPPPVTLSIRSSGRTARRKRDSTPPSAPPAKKSTKTSSQPVPTGTPEVKARRSWELWTSDDKNTFFEALYEHGKDFDAIQNYIASKHKKRGGDPPVPPKDKDQVRGFYYREWHKISKHLDFGDDIKKQTQELYALINYGVLRRKVGGRLTEKNAQKLQDLINKGVTTVRMKVKGKNGAKNIRIKTPLCRALKKLNNIDEPKEEEPPRLPSGIVVTLRPHDNAAFSRVHALAQNPCARITVAAQKRLSALTTFLQNKWRSPYSKLRKQLGDSAPDNDKVIRLKPPRDLRMSALSVEPYEQHTTRDVTLTSYRRKVLRGKPEQDVCRDGSGRCDQEAVAVADAAEARTSRAQPSGESGKPGCDARATASDGGDVAVAAETSGERGAQPVAAETTSSCRREGESRPDAADGVRRSVVTETVYQRTLSEDAGGGQVDAVSSDEGDKGKEGLLAGVLPEPQRSYKSEVEEEKLRESSSESEEGQQEEEREKADVRAKRRRGRNAQQRQVLMSEERIRQGWTAADAGKLTIGELYLMLNSPEVIVLEYEWVSPDNAATASAKRLIQALEKLLLLAGTEFSVAKQKQLQQVGGNSASPCRCGALPLSQAATPPSSRTPGARSPATPRSSTPRAGAVRMQSPITPKSSRQAGVVAVRVAAADVADTLPQPAMPAVAAPPPPSLLAVAPPEQPVFAVPTVAPPNSSRQRAAPRVVAPGPDAPPPRQSQAFMEQLGLLGKRSRNVTKMGQRKPSRVQVVQRTLMPKAEAPMRHMMSWAIVPNNAAMSATGSFVPLPQQRGVARGVALPAVIVPAPVVSIAGATTAPASSSLPPVPVSSGLVAMTTRPSDILSIAVTTAQAMDGSVVDASGKSPPLRSESDNTEGTTFVRQQAGAVLMLGGGALVSASPRQASPMKDHTQVPGVSPPSMSSLFEISLQSNDGLMPTGMDTTEKLIDYALGDASFSGFLSQGSDESIKVYPNGHAGIASLPQGLYRSDDLHPWLAGEEARYSFSNLLEDEKCGEKSQGAGMSAGVNESSRDSILSRLAQLDTGVETSLNTALHSVLLENSIDYSAKFADLAAQIAMDSSSKKT